MHYYQHMGYPITYHQRIAIPIHFIHSDTLFHIQFFYPQQTKNLTSPHLQKNCCQVLPTPLEDAQMPVQTAHFIGFLGIHSSILILP